MEDRERVVNRLCARFLDRVGLHGWWTEAGPGDAARIAATTGRRGARLPRGQWIALQLAFAAWRIDLIRARTDYWPITVADLLTLDARTSRRCAAFIRGVSRKIGGAR